MLLWLQEPTLPLLPLLSLGRWPPRCHASLPRQFKGVGGGTLSGGRYLAGWGAVGGSALLIPDIQGYQRYLANREAAGRALAGTRHGPSSEPILPKLRGSRFAVSGPDGPAVGSLLRLTTWPPVKSSPPSETLRLMMADVTWDRQAMRVAHIYINVTGSTLPPVSMAPRSCPP
jgi:hypothetical protein